jgi:hypothetical protein
LEDISPELDGRRIARVAKERQAALRAGSYCLVAAGGCAVAGADLGWRAVRRIVLGEWVRPTVYLLAAGVFVWVCIRFARKAGRLRRQAREKSLTEPTTPPDFSTLSDGSQFAKNLERIE